MRPVRSIVPALLLAALGCGGGKDDAGGTGPAGGGTQPNRVIVGTTSFSPAQLTVPMAAVVTWQWNSCTGGSDPYGDGQTCITHAVVLDDGSAASERQSSGSFQHAFGVAGTYPYHCAIHGAAMSGKIVAQ